MASSLAAEAQSGQAIVDVQKHLRHPDLQWMGATLDGRVRSNGAVFEAKFMLPWSFSEEAALEKHAPQLQHNMWVVAARSAVLSIITGSGKWVEIKVTADPLYQHLIVTAERKFWRCVESGEPLPCSGSSLRSRASRRFASSIWAAPTLGLSLRQPLAHPEDDLLSWHYRPALEKHGFRWAPEQLASRFMFECARTSPNSRHFMFHDSFNFPFVLDRHRLAKRLRLMLENAYLQRGHKIAEIRAGRMPLILPRLAAAV